MSKYEGTCPRCNKTHYSDRKGDLVICDCWRHCPLCGSEMVVYESDLAPKTYGVDGKREYETLLVCNLHSPPFYSSQKPVEVTCS